MHFIHSALREFAPPSSSPYVVKSREFSAMKMPRGKSNVSRTERRPDRVARSLFIINRDCETSNNRDRNGWREQRQCSGHLEIPLLSQMTFARCVLRKWAVGNYTYFVVRHTLLVALRKYHFEFPSSTRVDIEHNLARTMPDFNVRSRENGTKLSLPSNLLIVR